MVATKFTSALPLTSGTAGEADARAAREEAIIAKAEADIDAGLGVEDSDVELAGCARLQSRRADSWWAKWTRLSLTGVMVRRVTTAPDALEALRQARLWLTQTGSGPQGLAKWAKLRHSRRQLATYPYLGAPVDGREGRYQIVVSEHRLIYRIDPDTGDSATAGDIRVLAVFGPGQP